MASAVLPEGFSAVLSAVLPEVLSEAGVRDDAAVRSVSTWASLASEVWQTSAQTLPRAGLVPASRIRVRTHSQDAADTPRPGTRVYRTACSRASGTVSSAGASRTASAQRCAPAA